MDYVNLDLDIRNYNLEDITNLFKIPIVFTESDLRAAKRIVLHTHPDKSKLPKEIFLFFTSAYKILYQIFTFRTGKNRNKKESYSDLVAEETVAPEEDSMKLCVERFNQLSPSEFNKLFNEHYEKCKIQMEEDQGYEDWFRSENDNDISNAASAASLSSWDQRVSEIDKQKQALRTNLSLISKNELQCANICGGGGENYYMLGQGAPKEHSSGLFSSLQYEDLKKAHTETVIPVTHEDYVNSKKFNNVNELQTFRDVHLKTYTYEESLNKKKSEAYLEEEDNTHRAFTLAKQDELAQEMTKKFNGSLFKSIMM
jgi:hypothetical protein